MESTKAINDTMDELANAEQAFPVLERERPRRGWQCIVESRVLIACKENWQQR